jgi:chromosome segregation ATPase
MKTRVLGALIAVVLLACRREGKLDESLAIPVAETITVDDQRRAEEARAAAERRRWADELASLEKRQGALAQERDARKSALAESKRELRERKRELERQKAGTSAYIDQHELQVACAYAEDAIRNVSGEYSEQTQKCAQTVSIYCAIAMVVPSFRRKVEKTRQHIDEAEATAKSLKAEIARGEEKIETQEKELHAMKATLDGVASEVAALREKLGVAGGVQGIVPVAPSEL